MMPIWKEVILMQAIDTGWGVKGMVFRDDDVLVLLNPRPLSYTCIRNY
jgi:hypothetical protein